MISNEHHEKVSNHRSSYKNSKLSEPEADGIFYILNWKGCPRLRMFYWVANLPESRGKKMKGSIFFKVDYVLIGGLFSSR